MKTLQSILYKVSCGIMLFFFGYVFYRTLGNLSHMEIINTYIGEKWAFLFSAMGAATLFFVLYQVHKLLFRLSSKTRTAILLLLSALGVLLQLYMIFGVRPCLRYDSLNPVDTAAALLKGADFSSTVSYEYFTIYPHNLPLTGYITALLKIAGLFGLSENNYIVFLQFINCTLIDFSLFSLFRLITQKTSEKNSCLFLLLCLINPLIYYYPVFFYTQVLCMPITTLLIVLFFELISDISKKKRIVYSAIYGIVLLLGWKIRILSLIVPIACGIFLILRGSFDFLKKRNFYISIAVLACSFLLCTAGNHFLLSSYGLQTDEEKAFPVHHWIMMGLGNDGSYTLDDELYTLSIETKEQRISENTKVIKQRISDLGVSGLLRLWGTKLANTWSDGYDDYADNLMLTHHYREYNDYLSGDRSELLAGFLHIYHSFLWLLLTVSVIMLLIKKQHSYIYTICLTILGGMIFHLFWESGEAYSMPFALLIIAGASSGWDIFSLPIIQKCRSSKLALLILAGLVLGNLMLFLHLKPTLFDVSFRTKEWAAVQDIAEDEYLYLKNGDVYTQTFCASRPFNRITLQYKYVSKTEQTAKGLLRLLNSDGICVYEQFLLTEDFFNGWTSELPTIVPNGYETFTVEITALEVPENSYWSFTAYNTGYYDVYQDGKLLINGIEKEKTDLTFHVYNDTQRTLLAR